MEPCEDAGPDRTAAKVPCLGVNYLAYIAKMQWLLESAIDC